MSGKYWLITDFDAELDYDTWTPDCWATRGISYSKGQLECCTTTGRLHWQFVVGFTKPCRLSHVKNVLNDAVHAELSRSQAANEYVHKQDTSKGRRWEFGKLPHRRNNKKDWQQVWDNATNGDILLISPSVRVCHYSTLRKIAMDHMKAEAGERKVYVFWGPTGTGKSRLAWTQAGIDAYPKQPTTKFWDGYQGQENVVIDEFTGQIDITHLLRWFDRYPVCVETKGSGTVLKAKKIWLTSNIDPRHWYQSAPEAQQRALLRRFTLIKHIPILIFNDTSQKTLPALPPIPNSTSPTEVPNPNNICYDCEELTENCVCSDHEGWGNPN